MRPTLLRLVRHVFLPLLGTLVTGCASTSTIKIVANVPAEAYVMNSEAEEEKAGATPLSVTLDGRSKTFVLRAEGYAPQHVVVVEDLPTGAEIRAVLEPRSEALDDEPPVEPTKALRASREQSRILDATLRAQRMLMRGQVAEARATVERLSVDFGDTFASLMLKGHVAGFEGDQEGAERFYGQLFSSRFDSSAAAGDESEAQKSTATPASDPALGPGAGDGEGEP